MNERMNSRIGFMQGRLSPMIDGRIQSFPWNYWEDEFLMAEKIDVHLMEWTIDSKEIERNPIYLREGRQRIAELSRSRNVYIPSVTSDYFMENPPWASKSNNVNQIHRNTLAGMQIIGSKVLVIPLVDNSSILNNEIEFQFLEFVANLQSSLREHEIKIAIESDFEPAKLSNFISKFDPELVGINYDIGNSASLDFNSSEELSLYGDRVINVHVKDRMLGGTTVPLGTGNADLPSTIQLLEQIGYKGNYILQTARAEDGKHSEAIVKYANMVEEWLHERNC
jgi:L-ribulose-5-phosphate 3-epimerase